MVLGRLTRASAGSILCFGDSWTYGNAYGLREQLRKHGCNDVKIEMVDYWGSTAEHFASNTHLLPNAVSKYKPDIVLLSMGGNDFKNIYWQKQYVSPWTALNMIENSLRTVLQALYKEHPNVKVVTYGYDFPGSIEGFVGSGRLDDSTSRFLMTAYRWLGVRVINYFSVRLGYVLESLSAEFAKSGNSLTYVPLWGSLQQAAAADKKISMKGYSLGYPSPNEYMNDPIHANHKGYEVLAGKLFDSYFGRELGRNVVIKQEA